MKTKAEHSIIADAIHFVGNASVRTGLKNGLRG